MKKSANFESGAVQRIANLVDLEKCCKMRIWMQKSASMQKRTSPLKFGDLAAKSGFNSVSNLSPSQIIKLQKARSRLYRSRFLQPNTHVSAFFEIYKICNPLHRSDLKTSHKKSPNVFVFLLSFILSFCKILRNFGCRAVQRLLDLVDLEKC